MFCGELSLRRLSDVADVRRWYEGKILSFLCENQKRPSKECLQWPFLLKPNDESMAERVSFELTVVCTTTLGKHLTEKGGRQRQDSVSREHRIIDRCLPGRGQTGVKPD